jgi:ABC-type multidrug transport system fused ATPase/permease subunit
MLLAEERNLGPFSEADPNRPCIEIDDASFTWDPSYPPFLKNIKLQIPRGSLVAVVGGTGMWMRNFH